MRRTVAALLLVLTSSLIYAQSYTIVDSVRLPAQSYVGDPVELRYRIRSEQSLSAPPELPVPTWGTIESIVVDELDNLYDVRIVVVPYEPGTLTLPRLSLGEVELEGFSLVVSSVLEDASTIEPIFGPQRLPGTRAALVVLSMLIFGLFTLLFYLLGPGRRHLRMLIARYQARLPYRRLRKDFTALEAQLEQLAARQFYIELVEPIKRYMSSVLRVECRAATTSELVSYLPALASLCAVSTEQVSPLSGILRRADDAKFASREIPVEERKADLELCWSLFESLETGRRRMRARHRRKEARNARV